MPPSATAGLIAGRTSPPRVGSSERAPIARLLLPLRLPPPPGRGRTYRRAKGLRPAAPIPRPRSWTAASEPHRRAARRYCRLGQSRAVRREAARSRFPSRRGARSHGPPLCRRPGGADFSTAEECVSVAKCLVSGIARAASCPWSRLSNGEVDEATGDPDEDQEDAQARKHDPAANLRSLQPQVGAVEATTGGVGARRVDPSGAEPACACEQEYGEKPEGDTLWPSVPPARAFRQHREQGYAAVRLRRTSTGGNGAAPRPDSPPADAAIQRLSAPLEIGFFEFSLPPDSD